MNGLPALRWAGLAWRPPISRQTHDLIAQVLLGEVASVGTFSGSEGGRASGGSDATDRLAMQLRRDPGLLIFAALSDGVSGNRTVDELAVTFRDRLVSGLAVSGSEPPCAGADSNPSAGWAPVAEKLWRRFSKLPVTKWLDLAHVWLELSGPVVPEAWRREWPTIIDLASSTSERVATRGERSAEGVDLADGRNRGRNESPEPQDYRPGGVDLGLLARRCSLAEELQQRWRETLSESKVAALRQFAYGLSHEINNPLANISTRAQGLLRGERDAAKRESLQKIIDQARRAHEMTADLMFYAHPPAPVLRDVDLSQLIRLAVEREAGLARSRRIEVRDSSPEGALKAMVDREMVAEALRALIRNAVEAIGCDGRVLVSGREVRGVGEADCVLIEVGDSGPGLSDEAARHAFDPYYSGREAGRGLGVGLCRVAAIAAVHGGKVTLKGGPAGCLASLRIPVGG